jgi:hypothetical protein
MDPDAVRTMLEQVETIWPTLRDNPIRVLGAERPPLIQTRRPGARGGTRPLSDGEPPSPRPAGGPTFDTTRSESDAGPSSRRHRLQALEVSQPRVLLAAVQQDADADADSPSSPVSSDPHAAADGATTDPTGETTPHSAGDVIISPGPNGLMMASEDLQALDTLESLLDTLAAQSSESQSRFHLFYLTHVEAETAKTLISSLLSGAATSSTFPSSSSSDSSRGGVLGQLLNSGSSALSGATAPYMVADNRLNALFVEGSADQIGMVDQLLDVIDIESGPEEVLTVPKPKMIPVYYTGAEGVAEVLRQLYADRIASNDRNQQAQRGRGGFPGFGGFRGFGGRDSGPTQGTGDKPGMTIGVDAASNSLWVSAPGPLLKEVESVVREIDVRAQTQPSETVTVLSLGNAPSEMVQEAIANVFNDAVQSSGSSSSASRGGQTTGRGPAADEMQRRMQFIQAMRGGFGGPPGGFGGPPGGFSGRGFGGRGDFGNRGGSGDRRGGGGRGGR